MCTLTQSCLREMLHYDPFSGDFTWLVEPAKRGQIGTVAKYVDDKGYIKISVKGKQYRAHRLVWLYLYGRLPANGLDHRDGNRQNNALSNLREATQGQNMKNRALNKNNKTGYKGVTNYGGKFMAQIMCDGKPYKLGTFCTAEDAYAAYCEASKKLHGDFGRTA